MRIRACLQGYSPHGGVQRSGAERKAMLFTTNSARRKRDLHISLDWADAASGGDTIAEYPAVCRTYTHCVQMENSLRRARLYRGLICPRRRVCPEWPGDRIRYDGGAGRSTNSAVRRRLPFVLRRRGNGNVVASKNRSVAFRNESQCACYGAFRKADTVCVLLGCHHDAAALEVLRPHRPPLLSTRACRVACKGTARRSSISGRL